MFFDVLRSGRLCAVGDVGLALGLLSAALWFKHGVFSATYLVLHPQRETSTFVCMCVCINASYQNLPPLVFNLEPGYADWNRGFHGPLARFVFLINALAQAPSFLPPCLASQVLAFATSPGALIFLLLACSVSSVIRSKGNSWVWV